jgi:hypothetical protein
MLMNLLFNETITAKDDIEVTSRVTSNILSTLRDFSLTAGTPFILKTCNLR